MSRIVSMSRVVSDLTVSERFYIEALGFVLVDRCRCASDLLRALGALDGAEQAVLQLGEEIVTLVQFAQSESRPAPSTQSNDLWFQHIAVVVSDIDLAYQHLSGVGGWHAITQDGPQRLPPSDGGVRAFKFKGPDGHPFELIWFPKGQGREIWADHKSNALFLGIDHTAMSISSTGPSVAFYQSLGFSVEHQTLNAGPKQSMLDAIAKALVDVTSMRPASARGMGIELLRYHPHGRKLVGTRPQDLITDWITLADSPVERAGPVTLLKDPDGHRVILTAA